MATRRFPFARPPALASVASALGWDRWAVVLLDDEALRIHFGPWRLRVPRQQIADAEVTGPYALVKVLGARLSLADRGLTFGTSAAGGACVRFVRPRSGVEPFGLLRHPAVTLTVADPEGLVAALTAPPPAPR